MMCGLLRLTAIFMWLAGSVAAQSLATDGVQSAAEPALIAGMPADDWDSLAARAEQMTETGTASRFALNRIRTELVGWRDGFSDGTGVNAGRLATVVDQIAALGPAGEDEPEGVAARRNALTAQQSRLQQPQILSAEAFARSNGLITEIDRQLRRIETERLTTRGTSPVNPAVWPAAASAAQTAISDIGAETWSIGRVYAQGGDLIGRIGIMLIGLIGAGVIMTRARAWLVSLGVPRAVAAGPVAAVAQFALSLASVLLPVLGLVLVVVILNLTGLFGIKGQNILSILPFLALLILVAKWLADFYFPIGEDDDGLLGYEQAVRAKGRRLTSALGWLLAASVLIDRAMSTSEADGVSLDVINMPFQLIVGVVLWQLGGLIVRHARPDTAAIFTRSRLRVYIGRAAQLFAIVGPLASILGYGAAANAITVPAIVSLAVVATVVVLQRLSYAVTQPFAAAQIADDTEADPTGLLPITINFALALVSLPVLALVWGVSGGELYEVWTRFLAGFSVGETKISPANFLTFIVVFMLGVLITRFIKTTLKTTVMPRTKFDLGGQNAVVAGFGYVGIFLSALVAFGVAGIDLSSLAIVAGALSVGIGFGLQNIVSNFVSGIILLIERPIGEGDMIEVGGQMGYVRDISVRSTRIETFDRTDVIVPNADLVSNQVINWTRGNSFGRCIVPVGAAYGSDPAQVMAILREVAEAHPMVLMNPPPGVLLMAFGADSVDFEIRAILRDVNFVMSARSEMLQEIYAKFDAAGIEIPFAQRDIWLRNPEALRPIKEGE